MNDEEKIKEFKDRWGEDTVKEDGSFDRNNYTYESWQPGGDITLDGSYSIEDLESLLWWMKKHEK